MAVWIFVLAVLAFLILIGGLKDTADHNFRRAPWLVFASVMVAIIAGQLAYAAGKDAGRKAEHCPTRAAATAILPR